MTKKKSKKDFIPRLECDILEAGTDVETPSAKADFVIGKVAGTKVVLDKYGVAVTSLCTDGDLSMLGVIHKS